MSDKFKIGFINITSSETYEWTYGGNYSTTIDTSSSYSGSIIVPIAAQYGGTITGISVDSCVASTDTVSRFSYKIYASSIVINFIIDSSYAGTCYVEFSLGYIVTEVTDAELYGSTYRTVFLGNEKFRFAEFRPDLADYISASVSYVDINEIEIEVINNLSFSVPFTVEGYLIDSDQQETTISSSESGGTGTVYFYYYTSTDYAITEGELELTFSYDGYKSCSVLLEF